MSIDSLSAHIVVSFSVALLSLQQKSYCTVLTEELSLRLRNNTENRPQEAADKDKEKA